MTVTLTKPYDFSVVLIKIKEAEIISTVSFSYICKLLFVFLDSSKLVRLGGVNGIELKRGVANVLNVVVSTGGN